MKSITVLFRYKTYVKKNLFALGFVLTNISSLQAQEALLQGRCSGDTENTKVAAKLASLEGQVQWKALSAEQWQTATIGDHFCYGDSLKVVQYRASLKLANDTFVRLNEGAVVKFIPPEKSFWLQLVNGLAYFISRTPKQFTVKTPYMNAAIDGTEFLVSATAEEHSVSVFEGAVNAGNETGSVLVKGGEKAVVSKGSAPRLAAFVRLQDAADWALYFPPVFANKHLPANLTEALAQGQYTRALAIINETTNASTSPDLMASKAAIELFYGQVELAASSINKALQLDGQHPLALSLQVLLTLVKGNSEQALQQALTLNQQLPDNAVVKLTLSYAQQAVFQLQAAFSSAQDAATIAKTESLAWARVAELALSLGKTRQAENAVTQALDLNPSLSRAQSIKGFVALQRHQTNKAQALFKQAIASDSGDPLPRFALGLSQIRLGQVAQGRTNIELAVALNPANSLFRSYLGKAYFEEKRHGEANTQFDLARQLDPDDPTPWFYQAILLQSENQPYQALQAMSESIELNDKRAVYRSRLLLDADEAARQTSQADIYLDLGFDALAKRSAAKSLAMAPDEHGGHRLLAESLINDSRADIARSSEVLQAQLLQPLTSTPIRSVLAEQDLLTIDSAGPGKLGINEFNSLFNRNALHLQTTGVSGSWRTEATDTVVSGLVGPISFALGDYNYHSDGYRENNDLEYDISTVFVQGQLSDSLKLMVEGRSRKEDRGDLTQRFLAGVFSETERLENESENARFGFHYTPNPSLSLLGVLDYIENSAVFSSESLLLTTPFFDVMQDLLFDVEERADAAELQFIFKQNDVNGIAGFKEARIDREETQIIEVSGFPGPPSSPDIDFNKGELEYENTYAYWNININKRAALALGMAYVEFNDEVTLQEKFSQWNPKVGIHFLARDDFSIRIAGFRNLKGPLLLEQSLEPTQVAGLNQFRDDADGTDSRNIALAIDHQVNENLALGIELVDRDLERPEAGSASDQELSDQLTSAYLYWALQNGSFSLNYYDEQQEYKTEVGFVSSPIKLKTKRLPLNFSYHHRNGLSFAIEPSYVNQHADFRFQSSSDVIVEKERFWILDLSAKYWFWQKQGVVAFEVKNAGKKEFQFQDTNFQDSSPKAITYAPERAFLGRISIRF